MSLMQVVGASFANLPLSNANSLLSQLGGPTSQPQTQPTVAPPPHDPQNTRLENKTHAVSELQNKNVVQHWVEADPRLNTHEESKLNPQVKTSKRYSFPKVLPIITLLTRSSTCLATETPTADHSS